MTIERMIRILAGIMILASLGLAEIYHQMELAHLSWLWLTVFIGLNMLQSGFTGFCPPEWLLHKVVSKRQGQAK